MPIPPDDVVLNKAAIIERCVRRVHAEYRLNVALDDFTHIDALTLNVERACQAAIDLAMYIIARDHLGMPQASADAFRLLGDANRLTAATVRAMRAMTGFRNIAIHQYRDLDMDVLRAIATDHWRALVTFCTELGVRIAP